MPLHDELGRVACCGVRDGVLWNAAARGESGERGSFHRSRITPGHSVQRVSATDYDWNTCSGNQRDSMSLDSVAQWWLCKFITQYSAASFKGVLLFAGNNTCALKTAMTAVIQLRVRVCGRWRGTRNRKTEQVVWYSVPYFSVKNSCVLFQCGGFSVSIFARSSSVCCWYLCERGYRNRFIREKHVSVMR